MTSKVFRVLLVATFIVCSSTFAHADGNVVTTTKVHQSRRLPSWFKVPNFLKPSKGIGNGMGKSGDETASAVAKGQKALDDEAAATARAARGVDNAADGGKAARGADDVVDVGTNTKITKADVNDLAKNAAKVTPKKSSKLKKVAKWAGYAILYSLALFGAYKLVTSGGTSSPPSSALSTMA